FVKQKTAYEIGRGREFRRVLFRSVESERAVSGRPISANCGSTWPRSISTHSSAPPSPASDFLQSLFRPRDSSHARVTSSAGKREIGRASCRERVGQAGGGVR